VSKKITGSATINLDGDELKTEDGATLNPGGANRTAKTGGRKVHGFQEEMVEPSLECTVMHTKDTSLRELSDITGATVFFETDTGREYVLRDAWVSEPAVLNAKEGTVPLKFGAVACEEIG